MGFKDTLGKVGKAAVRGGAWYLEQQSKSVSQSKNYTDEQREGLRDFSNRMHGVYDRFSDNNEERDDEYEDY